MQRALTIFGNLYSLGYMKYQQLNRGTRRQLQLLVNVRLFIGVAIAFVVATRASERG